MCQVVEIAGYACADALDCRRRTDESLIAVYVAFAVIAPVHTVAQVEFRFVIVVVGSSVSIDESCGKSVRQTSYDITAIVARFKDNVYYLPVVISNVRTVVVFDTQYVVRIDR